MVASKSALVAFIFTAMATAWMISAARVADDVTAEHAIGGAVDHELHQHAGVAAGHRRLDRAEIGLVDVDVAELRARLALRSGPTVPTSGCENTAVGIVAWSTWTGRLPNTVSAKAWPSRIATGVRLMRWVTSPIA